MGKEKSLPEIQWSFTLRYSDSSTLPLWLVYWALTLQTRFSCILMKIHMVFQVHVHVHTFWKQLKPWGLPVALSSWPEQTFTELQVSELPSPRALIISFLNYSKILHKIFKVGEDTNHLWLPATDKRPPPKKWPKRMSRMERGPGSLWWCFALPNYPLRSR